MSAAPSSSITDTMNENYIDEINRIITMQRERSPRINKSLNDPPKASTLKPFDVKENMLTPEQSSRSILPSQLRDQSIGMPSNQDQPVAD